MLITRDSESAKQQGLGSGKYPCLCILLYPKRFIALSYELELELGRHPATREVVKMEALFKCHTEI